MEIEGLEAAIIRWVSDRLDDYAGPEHYVECHPDFDGLVAIVKRKGSKTWRPATRFNISWRDMLSVYVGRDGGLTSAWERAIKERAV